MSPGGGGVAAGGQTGEHLAHLAGLVDLHAGQVGQEADALLLQLVQRQHAVRHRSGGGTRQIHIERILLLLHVLQLSNARARVGRNPRIELLDPLLGIEVWGGASVVPPVLRLYA